MEDLQPSKGPETVDNNTKSEEVPKDSQPANAVASGDEIPGPSGIGARESDKLQIIDITDDTSNSSHASELSSKQLVIEPDDVPPKKVIPKSTNIIEITDSNNETDDVEYVETTPSDSSTVCHLEKIPEEVEYVSVDNPKDTDLLENENVDCNNLDNDKTDNVIENPGDLSDKVHEVSVNDIVKNKGPSTVQDTIESEVALLEKSAGDDVSDSIEQEVLTPVTNGLDNTKSNESSVKEKLQLKIPPHLVGHNLEKPVEIVKNGRLALKPRLGVKIPNKNLSSQIVSKQDITDEVMERSRQRHSSFESAENIVFAKKMTNRLASKILSSGSKKVGTAGATPTVVTLTSSVSPTPSNDRIANNSDLIALLEGDDDTDWNEGTSKKSPVKNVDWERETALKQLNELPRLGKRDIDDEPRLSLNPVTKTYTRKRKPSEDIQAILDSAKKPSITPTKPATTTPLKALSNKLLPGSTNKIQKSSTPKQDEKSVTTPKHVGEKQALVSSTKKKKLLETKTSTPQKSEVTHKQLPTPEKADSVTKTPESPKTSQKQPKSFSIQKSIQKIRSLATPRQSLQPHTKLSSDKKALIILSSPEKESKRLSSDQDEPEIKTPAVKKPLSPNTYISKSSRIVKRKKIWDPDEATPTKLVKTVRQVETPDDEQKPTIEKKQSVEKKVVEATAKKLVEKAAESHAKKVVETAVKKVVDTHSKKGSEATAKKVVEITAKKVLKKAIVKKKKAKRTEIDRLLGDEGAVNMLYSVRNSDSVQKKNKSVISLDKAERELLNRTKEIKSDLLHNHSVEKESPIGLRKKAAPILPILKDTASIILNRKKSKDSTEDSVQLNTPPSSPAYAFHTNVSRIIRRHSSSSFTSKDSGEESGEENDVAPRKRKEKQRKSSVASATTVESKTINAIPIGETELPKFLSFNVRKFDHLVQIILVPISPNAHITLTLKVLKELSELLKLLESDSECRVVVVSSAGNSFCLGIDYKELVASTSKDRNNICKQYADAVRSFLLALSKFPKVIVAGVHGNAIGLGVTMLPLFDMVLASDTATFSTQYTRLGCAAEGGALLKLPHVMHNALASELFYASRILTAAEALRLGLVTRTLWPDKFQEELISMLKIISGQSLQSMQAIKKHLRHQLLTSVEPVLKMETSILIQHWTSDECQKNFATFSFESK